MKSQVRAANVRERPTVAVRKGPLFDIRGSVLAMGVIRFREIVKQIYRSSAFNTAANTASGVPVPSMR